MLQDLLGTHLELPVRLAIAAVVIVVLLGLTVVIVRALSGRGRGPGGRSRQARLAVMDSVPVDQKRRLILVRRDDVEHLLLIGGNRDLVVEPSIPRGLPREQTQPREALPLREAGREAIASRETTLLRRAPASPPLVAPPPASAGAPDAHAPAVEAPAAKAPAMPDPAAPSTPGSRFAALRRPPPPRAEGDLPARASLSGESLAVPAAATAATFSAAKRVFESRTPSSKAPEPRAEERTAPMSPAGAPAKAPPKEAESAHLPAEPISSAVPADKVEAKVEAKPDMAIELSRPVEPDVVAPMGVDVAPAAAAETAAEPVALETAASAEIPVPILAPIPAPEPVVPMPAEAHAAPEPEPEPQAPQAEEKAEPTFSAARIEPAFDARSKPPVAGKVEPTFDMPAAPMAEDRPVEAPIAKAELKIEDLLGSSPIAAETEQKIEPKIEPKIETKIEPKIEPQLETKLETKFDLDPPQAPATPEAPAAPPQRRAPVFSFGRPGREPPPRAEPKLDDLSARLQTSLDKSLHAPRDRVAEAPAREHRPVEPPAAERTPRATASFPPATFSTRPTSPPVPPFVPPPAKPVTARPASPFRAAPLPPEIRLAPPVDPDGSEDQAPPATDRMDSHSIGPDGTSDADALAVLDSAPPVRVVEPESSPIPPISQETLALIEMEAGLNLETDLMRELELTLAQDVAAQELAAQELAAQDAAGQASVAPFADSQTDLAAPQGASPAPPAEAPAAAADAKADEPDAPETPAAAQPAAAQKEAATVDPFEDLEAEMASLLGRAPRR